MNAQRRQAAIEAGLDAVRLYDMAATDEASLRRRIAAVIDAAAPHLEAAALRDAAEVGNEDAATLYAVEGWRHYLRHLADRVERGDTP